MVEEQEQTETKAISLCIETQRKKAKKIDVRKMKRLPNNKDRHKDVAPYIPLDTTTVSLNFQANTQNLHNSNKNVKPRF